MKMHAIMEKTAQFIAANGQQMEIVIKTKQANNPQFDFLSFTHYLNPFYKHLVKMIKSGKYRPIPQDVRRRMEQEQSKPFRNLLIMLAISYSGLIVC